jgi:hypothetical protein
MQHGSILLSQSEYTPALPGIRELTGVELSSKEVMDGIVRTCTKETGWQVQLGQWSETEKNCIQELKDEKYHRAAWNEKR